MLHRAGRTPGLRGSSSEMGHEHEQDACTGLLRRRFSHRRARDTEKILWMSLRASVIALSGLGLHRESDIRLN
jgi:hypothetical protein